jgi:AcrR family transcriptional regulator
MGYSPEHKMKTRQRVVESAGRLFRRHGYNGVGIDDIMAAANLTRGGFYAHFRSKAELFAATLEVDLELAKQLRGSGDSAEPSAVALRRVIDFYLDRANHKCIAGICPLVSLSADVSRAGAEVSAAYTSTLRRMVDDVARRIPSAGDAQARALAAVALCVGGVVLAHAVDDEQLADALLDACHARAMAEVEGR